MKYCSVCATELIRKTPDGDTHERHVCENCGHIHYQNPKIITGVIPIWKDQILLCKRSIEPQYGKWTIPSGFMEMNETVEEGALREAKEEVGISCTIRHLFTLYSVPHIGQVYCLFLADMTSDYAVATPETSEFFFATQETIPWDDIAFAGVKFSLENYFKDNTILYRGVES